MDNFLNGCQLLYDDATTRVVLPSGYKIRIEGILSASQVAQKLIDYRNHDNQTWLHEFDIQNHLEDVKFLLETGVDINAVDRESCLHLAVKTTTSTIYAIRGYKSSPHLRDTLEIRIQLIKYLLNSGADYNKKNIYGLTPIDKLHPDIKQQVIEYIELIKIR